MAKIITDNSTELEIKNLVIRDESPHYVSFDMVTKTDTIIVNNLVVIITKVDGVIGIKIVASIAPLPDGSIPIIDFNLSEEPINFTEDGFRLTKITSVIQKQAYAQYPNMFKSEDPDVIINNYCMEIRKDGQTFPDFRNTILDTLESVFDIEV